MASYSITREAGHMPRYTDDNGNPVYVTGSNGCWFTVRDITRRVWAEKLPICRTRESAQADLDAYAAERGWKVVKRNGNKN